MARRSARWARGAAAAAAVGAAVVVATPACTESRAPRSAMPLEAVAVTTGADAYRSRGADGRGVDVALVDTGVSPVPGLSGAVAEGVDLTAEAGTAYASRDGYGHGTHLAGIIAGRDGLAPGARVVPVKVSDRRGESDLRTVVAGIDWVVRNRDTAGRHIRVLNLSYGAESPGGATADALTAAVERAWRAGIVVVVSAGNGGTRAAGLDSPATDPFVLAVGASDGRGTPNPGDDVVATFSSRGDARRTPDLLAPGTSVVSLRAPGSAIDREFRSARVGTSGFRGSGTSQAAAVVSGAAALVLSRSPELTPDRVKALLIATAAPLPGVRVVAQGFGLLDLRAAALSTPPAAVQGWGPATAGAAGTERLVVAADWSGNRWRGNRWRGNRWRGNRWSSASWES